MRIRVHLLRRHFSRHYPPTALRLAATRTDHTVVYTSPVTPELEDRFTAHPAEWLALTTAPAAQDIEIAVTRDLHAEGWGPTLALPILSWAFKLYPNVATSPAHPVIVSEPISALTAFAAGVEAGASKTPVGWEVGDLYLVASGESKSGVGVGFKGAPFVDGATGLAYFRERWLDLSTGMWLSADPMGYADSSNGDAFARLDPVNLSDPTGELAPLVVAALWWAGGGLAATAADIAIDYVLADEGQFDINASIGTNLTVNALTGGLSRVKYLRHLGRVTRFGVEFGSDVAVTGTVDLLAYDQSPAYAYGSAAVGGAIGRGAPMLLPLLGKSYRRFTGVVRDLSGSRSDDFITFYHATSVRRAESIRKRGIDLSQSRRELDFGPGFYTTTDRIQAEKWANRMSKAEGGGTVLEYHVRRAELQALSGLRFSGPSASLGRFVRHHRLGGRVHRYDFVEGPMLGNTKFLRGESPEWWGQPTSWHTSRAVDLLNRSLQ